tara:strand:- start:22701 stop:24785 length:2085 start_codon:yes stop_codon:yes gene_type:complete
MENNSDPLNPKKRDLRQFFNKILTKIFKPLKDKLRRFFPAWPSFWQWSRALDVLSKKERMAFTVLAFLFFISSIYLTTTFYSNKTEVIPAFGGKYIEGIVGQPRFINPIYAANSDADRDLVELVFSGLMKYDSQGNVVLDLAKDLKINDDEKTYELYLKEDIFWHDNQKLSADDIIFTVKTIQNADYRSPLRANWLGVEVEKIENQNGSGIRFKLKKPYAAFLERLTLKIIPEHIWQDVPPQNFPLSLYNLNPVGSGPYRFKNLKHEDSGFILSLDLISFPNYFNNNANLAQISFRFFEDEEKLIKAANEGDINGLSISLIENLELISKNKFKEYSLSWPRYFALFFNSKKSKFLGEEEIRQGLNYAINKEEIVENILKGKGNVVHSPILPDIFGFNPPSKTYAFDPEKAAALFSGLGFEKENEKLVKLEQVELFTFKSDLKVGSRGNEVKALQTCLARDPEVYPEGKITSYFGSQTKAAVILFQEKYAKDILEPWGFKEGTGLVSKTTRQKLNEICGKPPEPEFLSFSLITVKDPLMKKTANLIKNQWESLGIEIQIEAFPVATLEKDYIKSRNYEIFLFGEALGAIPDLFPFWHSSQKKDPGLNLTHYESEKADTLLEVARVSSDPQMRREKYEAFQDILIEAVPAVFLYTPNFVYLVSKEIKGIDAKLIVDPSKRFTEIDKWYIKTKRAWK